MKTIQYTFKINGIDTTANSINDLEATIETLNEEISKVALGSKEFDTLSEQIRKANSAMANLEKTMEGADTVKVAESFAKLGEGIAGGFAIATSASALFGSESEQLAQAEAKAQQAIALVMGARAIAESVVEGATAARLIKEKAMNAINTLTIVNTKLMTFLFGQQTVATASQAVATEGATVAQKALNLAMKMSPIGLLIAGITALVAAVAYFSESNTDAAESQADLNQQMLLGIDTQKKLNDQLLKNADFQIQKLKDLKAGEDRLYQAQVERNNLALEQAKTEEGRALQGYYATKRQLEGLDAESEAYKKLREQLDKFSELVSSAAQKRIEASRQATSISLQEAVRIRQSALDAGKKVAEEQMKADEETKKKREEAEKRRKEEEDRKLKESQEAYKLYQDNLKFMDEERAKYLEEWNKSITNDVKAEEEHRAEISKSIAIDTAEEIARMNREIRKQEMIENAELNANKLQTANDLNNGLQALSDFTFTVMKSNSKRTAEEEEKAAKKQFETNKKIQLSGAIITGIQSVLSAFANGMKNPVPLLGPATAAVYASLAGITAAANIAKIESTRFESTSSGSLTGGGGSIGGLSTPNLTTGNITSAPMSSRFSAQTIGQTGTISGQGSGGSSTQGQRVFVLEADITKTQNKVSKVETLSSF